MKNFLFATLVLALLALAVVVTTVTGSKPTSPSGPHGVRFEVARLDISGRSGIDGRTSAHSIEVGVWLPEIPIEPRRLPLVIYVPGWGSSYDDNSVLCRTLASHGYGVVAISDIAIGARPGWYTADDDGARLAKFDVSTTERQIQFSEDAERRVQLAAERISQTLDAVDRAQMTPGIFGVFNLDVVGAIGASFGGASVAEAALTDGRIGLAVDLDGLVFGAAARSVIPKPYIEFNSTVGVVPISEIASTDPVRRFLAQTNVQQVARQERQRAERRDAFDVTIRGTRHQDFTDELYDWSRALSWRPWRERLTRPARVREIIDTLTLAALDEWIGTKYGRFTQMDRSAFPDAAVIGGGR
ncbi:MAG TPA: hypothetical protein PK970_11100 [Hyphomicrobiaceae bacterium]|nr:hypothetical protein [Hyphomicrobiaceae bacterium]